MREGRPEGIPKEIPVQQGTVDAFAQVTKDLIGKRISKTFPVGDPEENTTLQIMNYPVAPWRRGHRDGMNVGREMYITVRKKVTVLTDEDIEDQTTITAMRLDTRRSSPPILRIDRYATDLYVASEIGEYYNQRQDSSGRPDKDKYRIPTEEEAQKVLKVLRTIQDSDQLKRSESTNENNKENDPIREQLEKEVNRIFIAAEEYIPKESVGKDIRLAAGDKTVFLSMGHAGDDINVSISGYIYRNGRVQQILSENYTSLSGMPLNHTLSLGDQGFPKTVSPLKDADSEQTNHLFGILESLSNEKIQTELSARSTITSHIDTILRHQVPTPKGEVTAAVQKKYVTIAVYRDKKMRSVYIENRVNSQNPDNTDSVREQVFCLYNDKPLEVATYKYGQELGVGEDISKLATEGETSYLTILLDELAQNPPS